MRSLYFFCFFILIGFAIFFLSRMDPRYNPENHPKFLPNLMEQINDVEKITIISPSTQFTIARHNKIWRLNDKKTVVIPKIRNFLVGISESNILEEKTNKAAYFADLLVDEKKFTRKIMLFDKNERRLAAIVVGRHEKSLPAYNRAVFYARHLNNPQTYLIAAALPPYEQLTDW